MSIKNLDPQVVWKNFYALTQIPRPSKHEEKAVEYMSLKDHALHILTSRSRRLTHDDISHFILYSLEAMLLTPVIHILDSFLLVL